MPDILSLLPSMGIGCVSQEVLVAIFICVGLLSLLCGYRLIRLFIFLVGFGVGTVVLDFFYETPIAVLGGLLAGALCCVLWYLGIFVIGGIIGMLIAVALGFRDRFSVAVFACVFGLLAIAIRKFMIIVSTSFSGANLLVSALSILLHKAELNMRAMDATLITIGLACVGIICQYATNSGKAISKPLPAAPATSVDDSEVTKAAGSS